MKTVEDYQKEIETISSKSIFENTVKEAKIIQDKYNPFVTICDYKESDGPLKGVPYALKDNISTKGILTTASSKILKDYVPVYSATVFEKLEASGAMLLGKTVLDELAIGGRGTSGHTGPVKNPWDEARISGGSSAGSAVAVATGLVPFAIGSDTGDSVRKPAALCGVVGFKPTYGLISRYGLFQFAASLDHIGVLSRSVKDAAIVTDIIKGYDEKDMTSLPNDGKVLVDTLDKDLKGKKLFYIKEIADIDHYEQKDKELEETLNLFHETLAKYQKLGVIVEEVSIAKELLNALYPAYITISCAESTSANANLNGIAFASRVDSNHVDDIMIETRTTGFCEMIKRRFVIGSYVLQKENQNKLFLNAKRVRRMIVEKLTELFKDYDGMILPSGGIAPLVNDDGDSLSDKYLILENHLCIANFGGFPSISIPMGMINKMPVGISITGKVRDDETVLALAHQLEKELDLKMDYREANNV